MELDQEEQKGLFTFYREQADLEDQLKLKKHFLKEARMEEKQKKGMHYSHQYVRNQNHLQSKNLSRMHEQSSEDPERKGKAYEVKDKLVQILKKYNSKQNKRRQKLRIIMESKQQNPLDNAQKLKDRLQRLQDNQEPSTFKLITAKKAMKDLQLKQKVKVSFTQRVNPFQKLALIPTNFINQFQNGGSRQIIFKKPVSPTRLLMNSVEMRSDRGDGKDRLRERYDLNRLRQLIPIEFNKLQLPKIENRVNSDIISNGSKVKPLRIKQKIYIDPIKSQRLKTRPQLSLLLESVKLSTESSRGYPQNKIYSLFIQNKQGNRSATNKQIELSDVLKRLKFS